MMIFKILGALFVMAGPYLIAGFDQHLLGALFMLVGFYLAMKKGMKPL
jgi:hypothetical protein